MAKGTWREAANSILYRVITDHPEADEKQLRKLIRDAYPWGERAYHPYKIWCSAVKECLWTLRRIGKRPAAVSKKEPEINLFNQPK